MRSAEVVAPFPKAEQKLGHATEIRTTLLVSSLQSLRKHGYLDPYLGLLPREHHATMQSMIAGQWVAIELGRAHYLACEGLALTANEVHAIGRDVGDRIEGTFMAVLLRMAGQVGATPWTALLQTQGLYDRVLRGGGGTSVAKVSPKDARVRVVGSGLADVPYFVNAMAGVFEVGAELFCGKAFAKVIARESTPNSAVLHVSWA